MQKQFTFAHKCAAALVATMLACGIARADYPDKPIQMVLPVGPGGGTDLMAREISKRLSDAWGQPVVIENKPGGGGVIAAQQVARSAPNGYTLLFTHDGVITATPRLYKTPDYEPLTDLAPITEVAKTGYLVVVNPAVPAKNLPELIAFMKEKKAKGEPPLAFATSAIGSADHLSGEMFRLTADVDMLVVPYKNSLPAMSDVIAGHVPFGFFAIPPTQPQIKSGNLRALAITTKNRSSLFPDLPTVAETLPGFESGAWYGIFAPAGTPKAIIEKIGNEVKRIVAEPDFVAYMSKNGFEGVGSTPVEFTEFIKKDAAKVESVIKRANVHVD